MGAVLQHDLLPAATLDRIAARNVALWIDQPPDHFSEWEMLAQLVSLPWRLVLFEGAHVALRNAIEKMERNPQYERARGLLYPIARDPLDTPLPAHSLGIYFLDGVEHGTGDEAQHIGRLASTRRRANMLKRLQDAAPSDILLLSWGSPSCAQDIAELRSEGLETRLLVCPGQVIEDDLGFDYSLIRGSHEEILRAAEAHLRAVLPSSSLRIRVQASAGTYRTVDLSPAVDANRPITNAFSLPVSSDLVAIGEENLDGNDLEGFFSASELNWKHYAAGLPWPRLRRAQAEILNQLRQSTSDGGGNTVILYVVAQPGSGATTFLRSVAFEAAKAGYPTLIARPGLGRPNFGDARTFLLESSLILKDGGQSGPAWLIAFDVEHFTDHEGELESYASELQRIGYPSVVLVASTEPTRAPLQSNPRSRLLDKITHEVSREDAVSLGRHLRRFLEPHGKSRSEHEWESFWAKHCPDDSLREASFWLALEFWLKRELDLSETIQEWLSRQLSKSKAIKSTKVALLRVAALAVGLTPTPLFAVSATQRGTKSAAISSLRILSSELPALGLVEQDLNLERVWRIVHSQLARYILVAACRHPPLRSELEIGHDDPIALRLDLIESVVSNPEIARPENKWLVEALAIRVLKLDSGALGEEFFPLWPHVLRVLTEQTHLVRTSRTYVHHVAISCRRCGQMARNFGASLDERVFVVKKAVELLIFALDKMRYREGDETDLNLLNSLARSYQDLAELESELGANRARLSELRALASEAASRAEKLSSGNRYVLETLASSLLMEAQQDRDKEVECATQALGYVLRAMQLDSALQRMPHLTRLATRALGALVKEENQAAIARLISDGNPLGYIASAWSTLYPCEDEIRWDLDISELPKGSLIKADSILRSAPDQSNSILIELLYKVTCGLRPYDFREQLNILEGLVARDARLPLQLDYERAVLFHQTGRHNDANRHFRHIRTELREGRGYVTVPSRLSWFVGPDGSRQRVTAVVKEIQAFRGYASVRGLGEGASVPFRPDEFGGDRLRVGQQFQCEVSFGPNGPLLRPVLGA
jgi:hypothetical protein